MDYIIFNIIKNIINIFDFEKSINYSKRLIELDSLSCQEISHILTTTKTLGFYYLFDYDEAQNQLETLLNQLLSCGYFIDDWREAVINFIDWIDLWHHSVKFHFAPDLFKSTCSSCYALKDMHQENVCNPPNSVLLLRHLQNDEYIVVQSGSIVHKETATKLVCINEKYSDIIAKRIKEFFIYLDFWIEQSGGEILLDPHYYIIR